MLLLAATMPLMLFWEVDTPYWVVGVVIAVGGVRPRPPSLPLPPRR